MKNERIMENSCRNQRKENNLNQEHFIHRTQMFRTKELNRIMHAEELAKMEICKTSHWLSPMYNVYNTISFKILTCDVKHDKEWKKRMHF